MQTETAFSVTHSNLSGTHTVTVTEPISIHTDYTVFQCSGILSTNHLKITGRAKCGFDANVYIMIILLLIILLK